MADFFNKLKKGLDKSVATVGAKSNTLIETNKIKSDISASTKQKKEALMQLGTRVYNMSREGQGIGPEAVEDLVTIISEADKKVAELEAKIVLLQEAEKEKLSEINAEDVVDVASSEVEDVVEEVKQTVETTAEAVEEKIQDKTDSWQ